MVKFHPFKTLVIGDFLLDTYTTGRVKRISPEAPVPILEVQNIESRPGGAGNVVLNLAALDAEVIACGRIGPDLEGKNLSLQLQSKGVDISGLIVESNYKTPVKNRLIAEAQQLLRVDVETIVQLQKEYEVEMIDFFERTIPAVQVVAVSDYGKGFLTPALLSAAIRIANQSQVPLVVDPKGADFKKYEGAYLLKPNLSEAYAAARLPFSTPLELVAEELLKQTNAQLLLITRSEAGISLFDRSGAREDFPVRSKEVKDVTGAGDTVLSMICLGLAHQLKMNISIQLANIAAGISIERIGCAQVTLSEISDRLREFKEPKLLLRQLGSLRPQGKEPRHKTQPIGQG